LLFQRDDQKRPAIDEVSSHFGFGSLDTNDTRIGRIWLTPKGKKPVAK
jgi:hypothetical protein